MSLNKRSLIYNKANLHVRKTKPRDRKNAHLIHELRSKSIRWFFKRHMKNENKTKRKLNFELMQFPYTKYLQNCNIFRYIKIELS